MAAVRHGQEVLSISNIGTGKISLKKMVSMDLMEKELDMDVLLQMIKETVTQEELMVEFITGLEINFRDNIDHMKEKDSFQP